MSQQYPGGFITKSPPATVGPVDGEGGSAPGVWTLDQAMALNKQGLWPKPPLPGELWSWGANGFGQLGNDTIVTASSPVQVGTVANWSKNTSAVATGNACALAIRDNGTLWAWGRNFLGQLGLNNTTNYSSPKQVGALTNWASVATRSFSVRAIKIDGTMWAWGTNASGQLGDGTTTTRSSPVQVGSLSDWTRVASGDAFTLAIKTDGTLWAWGNNLTGQLGLGNEYSYSSPKQVGSLTTWSRIAAGNVFSVAVKTDGTLWTWGGGGSGELGVNPVNRSSPVQVGGLTNWLEVSCGAYHTIAVKTDGTLWGWGSNSQGVLGLNDTANRSSPVQIGALTTWQGLPTQMTVSSAAIKTPGTLWMWGLNSNGQLGLNSDDNKSSPVQVGSLTTWRNLSMAAFTIAVKTP